MTTATQVKKFGRGAVIGAFVGGIAAGIVAVFGVALAAGLGEEQPGPQNEFAYGESIPLDNSLISGAFTECGKATTDKFPDHRKAVGEPTPKFAYMAGDGVVVVGAEVTNGAVDVSGMSPTEMFEDMHRALVVCSVRDNGEFWEVVDAAQPELLRF